MVDKNKSFQFVFTFLVCLLLNVTAIAAPVTSPFGWRIHPIDGQYKFHTGMDIGMDFKEPIGSLLEGVVKFAGWYGGYGNCVIVSHQGGDHTLYGHMDSVACQAGDVVKRGSLLGYVGSTGYSTGPHLHLEWWHNGVYTDPTPLVNGSVTSPAGFSVSPVVNLGEIGYTFNNGRQIEKKKQEKVEKKPSLMKDIAKDLELTAKDYMLRAVVRRMRGRKDNALATKYRRRAAFVAAGVGAVANDRNVVKTAVRSMNGFSF